MNLFDLTKKHGEKFTKDIIEFLNEHGWDSYSKKEIKLFLFFLAQKYEYITPDKVNLEFAKKMKMTKTRLKNVLLESQLHFGNISSDVINILSALFENNETTYNDLQKGEFKFNIRNPILKEQLVDLLEENRMTPDFKNNKAILILEISSLMNLIEKEEQIKQEDLFREITDNIKKENITDFNGFVEKFNQKEITLGNAVIGFLKEQSEDKIGKSITEYFPQKLTEFFAKRKEL